MKKGLGQFFLKITSDCYSFLCTYLHLHLPAPTCHNQRAFCAPTRTYVYKNIYVSHLTNIFLISCTQPLFCFISTGFLELQNYVYSQQIPPILRSYFYIHYCNSNNWQKGCRHSSVDLSVPTILPPWVQIPSTPSMLLSFIVIVLYLSCEKNKNKQKEAIFLKKR